MDINYLYGLPQDLFYPLYILYSMVDITRQVSEGQKKWRQRVDVTSISDVNKYISFKIFKYRYFELINNNLWEQYQKDFMDFIEAIFKAYNPVTIYKL